MARRNIVDAGVVAAYLDRKAADHDWAVEVFSTNKTFLTCEAVLSEACARVEYSGGGQERVVRLVAEGILTMDFSAQANIVRILRLMDKYADRPMDFADACLVVMTEGYSDPMVFTNDSDFRFYRRRGRDAIPFISPGK